jgi:hypothetical protein
VAVMATVPATSAVMVPAMSAATGQAVIMDAATAPDRATTAVTGRDPATTVAAVPALAWATSQQKNGGSSVCPRFTQPACQHPA